MDSIHQWLSRNLDIVFFIYGLAFVVMGIAILTQPKRESGFKLAGILWLLAGFGLIHGMNEWLDMWAIIKGRNTPLDIIRWFVLVASYIFLFEFGRQLFRLSSKRYSLWFQRIANLLAWWLTWVILSVIFIVGFSSSGFWETGSILARYLLGLPGGLLTGFGFFLYYRCEKEILDPLKEKKYFWWAGLSFLAYSALGGLVVPKADFFPANWLNTDSFLSVVKIPVQVFRTICAIIASSAICEMLRVVNWMMIKKLQREVAERKKTEEELMITHNELKQTQNQLIQSEKMAAVGQLASGIAHEIKNPLAIIIQGLESLRFSKSSNNASSLDTLERLTKATLRADKTVKDLLDFSRQSPSIFEELNVSKLIEESLSLVEHQMSLRNIKIIKEFNPDLPRIKIDANQMRQVFINILVNALDAMPEGGTVTIYIEQVESNYLQIKFTDTGCGIPQDNIQKVFDPFFTTKRKKGSAGLGLSVTKGIIEAHGGTIEIKSKVGEGTSAIIKLPISAS